MTSPHLTVVTRRRFLQGLGAAAVFPTVGYSPGLRADDSLATEQTASATHTVVSCNIRLSRPELDPPEEQWERRRELCLDVIKRQRPDVICMQEVLRDQWLDFQTLLPEFRDFGFPGPEMDAHPTGYFGVTKNVVLYRADRYDCTSAGGYWLSETPHLPGTRSWGSARARHANWMRLKDRSSGRELRVLNTHLDHKRQEARERQIAMILEECATYAEDFPQLLVGDLNADHRNRVLELCSEAGWADTADVESGLAKESSFHGFRGDEYPPSKRKGKIDFILSRGTIETISSQLLREHRGGFYPSDHYFVRADLRLV